MNEILECDFVKKKHSAERPISSSDPAEFKKQYRLSLEQTKGIKGVVYVFRSEGSVPRLKGDSNILYVGETKHDVWSRYNVENDTDNFWHVYEHIINKYGSIYIDVYKTENHKETEKNFLKIYFNKYKELPPMNRKG